MTSGSDDAATATPKARRDDAARLVAVVVADAPKAWADAGFTVGEDGVVRLAAVDICLIGAPADPDAPRGVVGWRLHGVAVASGDLDGLPTEVVDAPGERKVPGHPNGVTRLDHIVVLTPDLDRTLAAFDAAGLELRRIRDTTSYGSPMRQAFFRLGPTVVEVVSGDTGTGLPATDAPATWFGLAVDVDDLDVTKAKLDERLGDIKVAVQEGRRIATFRHRTFGISVALAAMDHHAGRWTGAQ